MKEIINSAAVEKLLRKLVSIKSPYFEEDEIMEYVDSWFKENGLDSMIHTYYEPKETKFHGKNVVGCLDSGKPGPVIYLGGHLDTVKLCNDWTRPPFEGVVEGDYMYGVGTLDMKSGCCAEMLAIKEFADNFKDKFCGKVVYHLVSDEEGPYGLGTTFIIQDKVHNIAEEADFAIITEPSAGFTDTPHPCMCLGARGGYNYKIIVRGKSTHAATPERGINALTDASRIMAKIDEMEPMHDEKLGKAATCVIGLTAPSGACSVPDYAEIEVFQHNVRGETMEVIGSKIEQAIKDADIKGTATVEFRQSPAEGFDGGFMPYCTDEDNKYVEILKDTVKEISHTPANISYFQSIGDFNHIGGKLGIPTVLLGPDGDNFHSYDERVNLKSTEEIAKYISKFLEKALV